MYHHEPSAVICKPDDQSSILWASRQRPRSCRLRLFATSARITASIFHRNCRIRKRSLNRRFTSLFSVCCRKESLFIKKMHFFLPMSDKVGQSLFEMLYLCIVKRHQGLRAALTINYTIKLCLYSLKSLKTRSRTVSPSESGTAVSPPRRP